MKKTKNQNSIDKAIDRLLTEMAIFDVTSEDYATYVEQLDRLYKIRDRETSDHVSKDALVAAGASLAGIIAILSFEKANVITSKALGFVVKSKL